MGHVAPIGLQPDSVGDVEIARVQFPLIAVDRDD